MSSYHQHINAIMYRCKIELKVERVMSQCASSEAGEPYSLVPRPPPHIGCVIRTASDNSCGGGLGTRLGEPCHLVQDKLIKLSLL